MIMKFLAIAIVLCHGCVSAILAAEGQESPITLEEAREQGRRKSRFLQEAETAPSAVDEVPEANVAFFHASAEAVLRRSCLACHGPKDAQGRLRVDQLNPDLLSGPDVGKWREIYNVLSNSEMPPEDEPEYALRDSERGSIVDWLSVELNKASAVRRNTGSTPSSSVRMRRYEYNYASTGSARPAWRRWPASCRRKLPDGRQKQLELLQMSAMQFRRPIARSDCGAAHRRRRASESVTYVI